jgi:2-hydroxy-6-oxonona-2,4-dienedioate hydrolase
VIGMFPARWIERGTGEPVVLLHGLMSEMDHWETTLEALAPICRALAPALPIFDAEQAEASIEGLANYVHRFMRALAIERAVLGGNSLGGHLALELALTHPERVAGLILTGSSGLFERSFTRGVPHRPTADYVREKMEEVFFDRTLVTPEWVESVRCTLIERASVRRVLGFARAAKRDNLEARLVDLAAPTLIVWGAEDRITPLDVAQRFQALIPRSRLVILPCCGHAPMLEHPQAFAGVVRHWLAIERLHAGAPARAGAAR